MDDRTVIERVRCGEHQMYGVLVSRYRDQVIQVCYRMTGDRFEAEDLAHDAFVDGFVKLHQLRDPDRFFPWLKTLALNLCRMWHRTRRKDPIDIKLEDGISSLAIATVSAPDTDAEDAFPMQLAYGISQLSSTHRMVLVLHYWEGLSYQEIATFLDVPIGTVMSRLHRARHALKATMEVSSCQEIPMIPEDVFRQEVEAEITTLVDVFDQEPGAMERLSVILDHSPERMTQLLGAATTDEALGRLAFLLRRLGPTVIPYITELALSPDGDASQQARSLLLRWIAIHTQYRPGPAREVHRLLDALIGSAANTEAKVELLADLLEASRSGPSVPLLASVILCYPDDAFRVLWTRCCALLDANDVKQHEHLISTLCRTGTRFANALLDLLLAGDESRQAVALAGLELLARTFQARFLPDGARWGEASPEQLATAARFRRWNAPPLPDGQESVTFARIVTQTASLVQHEHGEIREPAIRILGGLESRQHLSSLHAAMAHSDLSTRMAALLSLGEIGAEESVPHLAKAACDTKREFTERRAAIDALARIPSGASKDVLLTLMDDPDAQIVRTAIGAIGIPEEDVVRAKLEELLASRNREVVKAAAKVLHAQRQWRPRSETTQKRLNKIRGDDVPTAFISTEVAIRALPEIRAYDEQELTRFIAGACHDYSTTRRLLVMEGKHSLMHRSNGIYTLTELGKAVWRVEHFIMENYLTS